MKRYVLIKQGVVLILMLVCTSNTFAMKWVARQMGPALTNLGKDVTWDNIGKVVNKVADGPLGKGINTLIDAGDKRLAELRRQTRERAERIEKENAAKAQQRVGRRKEALDVIANKHATPEAKNAAARVLEALTQEEIEQDKAAQKRIAAWDELERIANSGIPALGNFVMDGMKQAQELDAQKVIASNNAYQKRKADVEAAIGQTKQWVEFVKGNPHLIVGVAGGIFGLWHGTKLAAKIIEDKYALPALADKDKTSILPWHQKLYNWVTGTKPPSASLSDAFFEPKLAERIRDISVSLKNIVANGGYLPNMLLWGPPGTGKTLVAMLMARTGGMQYIYFSGSSLENYTTEEAVRQLTQLFRFAADYPEKLTIIIDEADAILGDRGKATSDKKRTLLTHILTYTGTETRDYSVMALTNRPGDLDEAYRSRCDFMIQVDVPAYEQVLDMVKFYVNKYLIEGSDMQPPKVSLYTRFFGNPPETKKVTVADGVFTNEKIEEIARTFTEHSFVGRDISKIILAMRLSAFAKDNVVTADIVQMAIDNKIAEKKAEAGEFKRKSELARANSAAENALKDGRVAAAAA